MAFEYCQVKKSVKGCGIRACLTDMTFLIIGILRNWEPEDNALSEHRRHFGQCPFLISPESVGNVKLGQEGFADNDNTAGHDPASHANGGEVGGSFVSMFIFLNCRMYKRQVIVKHNMV